MRTRALPLRLVFAILFVSFSLAAAQPGMAAGPAPIKLRVGGRDLSLSHPAVYDGREVYVPLEALQAFGASSQLNQRGDEAQVTFADGRTDHIAVARPGGLAMLPLSEMAEHLGSDTMVSDGVCQVRARIRDLSFERGRLRVTTSFPLPASGRTADEQDHATFALDLPGAALPSGVFAPKVPGGENRLAAIQVEPSRDGVRVVLTIPAGVIASVERSVDRIHTVTLAGTPAPLVSKVEPKYESSRIQGGDSPDHGPAQPQRTAQGGSVQSPDSLDTHGPSGQSPGQAASTTEPPTRSAETRQPRPGEVLITGVDFQASDSAHARLRIATRGKTNASVVMLREPTRLAIDLPNCQVESEQRDWKVEHPFLSAIHAIVDEKLQATRIVLDLARMVGYHLLDDSSGITIDLGLPRNTGIRLNEATVVIDAGHGGPATGCWSVMDGHKIYEKNITLSVARKVRELFQEAGTNVLMTRTTDVDVPLKARPALANDNNAAVFVSIHVDEMPGSSRPSGSTAYYHFDDPSSRALAQSIIEQVARVSGLPNRRARSDRTLYQTGLSVLRNSAVPATLVEIGFMSNPGDRAKLLNESFQQVIAKAIFDGVRGYLEAGLSESGLRRTPVQVADVP